MKRLKATEKWQRAVESYRKMSVKEMMAMVNLFESLKPELMKENEDRVRRLAEEGSGN